MMGGDEWREWMHILSAGFVAGTGVPGFFRPRAIPPILAQAGSEGALSFYDSAPLAGTLDAHVDWDRLNDGPMRLSVGAVNVESGNFHYRSEEHTSELQSLMRISYAVFCLKKKKKTTTIPTTHHIH